MKEQEGAKLLDIINYEEVRKECEILCFKMTLKIKYKQLKLYIYYWRYALNIYHMDVI